MEPIFKEGIGRSHLGSKLISNPNQEPIEWECVNCGFSSKNGTK